MNLGAFSVPNEWIVAGAIVAAPLALFLVAELVGLRRRRRERAIAQRPKNRSRDVAKSRSRRAL